MSTKPALGSDALDVIADALCETGAILHMEDVPNVLFYGKKAMPLGRTLIRHLRLKCGLADETPESVRQKAGKEMRRLQRIAQDDPAILTKTEALLAEKLGRLIQLDHRERFKKGKKL